MKRKAINYLLIIDMVLTLLVALGLFLSLKECRKDKIYSKWEVSFSMQLNERINEGNAFAGTLLNEESTMFSIDVFSSDESVPIKINASRYNYVNEKREKKIEEIDGAKAYNNTKNIEYYYVGNDENEKDNLLLTPIFPNSLGEGYLYLKLDEGIHEIKFIFPSGDNIVGAEYKVIINVKDNRKEGLKINFAGNYLKKYSASQVGDYDLYFVESYPSFEFLVDETSVGVFNNSKNDVFLLSDLFSEDDRIRITMKAAKVINGEINFYEITDIKDKGLYLIQVSVKDSWEYKSIVYRCYIFVI